MSKTTNLTAYEKKCASNLAHAFYDTVPEWQKDLPPFKEILAVAKELVHHENTCERRESLRSSGIPLMPSDGFDYIGVEYYLDKACPDYYGNLRESLMASMRSTYAEHLFGMGDE